MCPESLKYKLNNRCTNNHAEQLAILKALQHTVNIHAEVKTATVYTDSRMTLNPLKNTRINKTTVDGNEEDAMAHPILLG